jgi:capsid protein
MRKKNLKQFIKPQASDLYESSQPYMPLTGKTTWVRDYNKEPEDNVSAGNRKTIVSRARQLYANMGAIKNAVQEKAEFTIGDGWNKATFLGKNVSWGQKATDYTNQWLSRNKIQQLLRQVSMAIDRDGDCLLVFTKYNNSVKLYSSNQLGNRNGDKEDILNGPYRGSRNVDGVIVDKYGQTVGYNILGEAEDGSEDSQISFLDAVLIQDPDFINQRRGVSGLAQAIPIFEQYKQIVSFEIRGIKHASSFAVQAHVEKQDIPKFTGGITAYPKGFGGSTSQVSSSASPTGVLDVAVEEVSGGTMNVFRAGSGAKLEVLNSDRPSQNTAIFLMDHCLRQAFLSLRWPVELSYDLNSRGATTKLVIAKATRTIDSRQSLIFRPLWTKIVAYAVTRGIENGILPFNKDFYRWQPDYPSQMSIDTFRDTKSDIESWNKAFMTGTQIASQYGYDYYANLRQKAEEIKYAKDLADEMGLPLETLIQMTPNGNMASSNEVESEETPEEDEEEEDNQQNQKK